LCVIIYARRARFFSHESAHCRKSAPATRLATGCSCLPSQFLRTFQVAVNASVRFLHDARELGGKQACDFVDLRQLP
jgi:hypothetical protein